MTDALVAWLPTINAAAPGTWFSSWSSFLPGTSRDLEFRVKNVSAYHSAEGVSVSLGYDGIGGESTFDTYATLSKDGHSFAKSVALGNLLPQQVSGILTLRMCVPAAQAPSLGEVFTLRFITTVWTSSLYTIYSP